MQSEINCSHSGWDHGCLPLGVTHVDHFVIKSGRPEVEGDICDFLMTVFPNNFHCVLGNVKFS